MSVPPEPNPPARSRALDRDRGALPGLGNAAVVGGGIAGITCARELTAAGVPVIVWDRGRRVGGRISSHLLGNRPVDVGAAYFTASDPAFTEVVDGWVRRGLARAWTDTFAIGGPDGLRSETTGPLRYAAPGGLRSLVADLARPVPVEPLVDVESVDRDGSGLRLEGVPVDAVVLAVPDPQAADLLGEGLAEEAALVADREWAPALTVYARWAERRWPDIDAVFVHDSEVLDFVADDGRRRGDGAPVLVAHSTAAFATRYLDRPQEGVGPMLSQLATMLGAKDEPLWVGLRRWSLARPLDPHPEPFFLGANRVGLCGDGWGGRSRVEAAFLSGRALGRALAAQLA